MTNLKPLLQAIDQLTTFEACETPFTLIYRPTTGIIVIKYMNNIGVTTYNVEDIEKDIVITMLDRSAQNGLFYGCYEEGKSNAYFIKNETKTDGAINMTNYTELYEVYEEADRLDEYFDLHLSDVDEIVLAACIEDVHGDIDTGYDDYKDAEIYVSDDKRNYSSPEAALGYTLVENDYLPEFDTSHEYSKYFDYAAYGKDSRHDGWITLEDTDRYIFYNAQ